MLPEFDWTMFEELYHNNNSEKFKIGQVVKYVGHFMEYKGKQFEVRAANRQDEESVEYLLAGFPYLVYGNELEEV